jgi:hypothetical protein
MLILLLILLVPTWTSNLQSTVYRGLQVGERAKAEVYTVIIILAIVLVYTDSQYYCQLWLNLCTVTLQKISLCAQSSNKNLSSVVYALKHEAICQLTDNLLSNHWVPTWNQSPIQRLEGTYNNWIVMGNNIVSFIKLDTHNPTQPDCTTSPQIHHTHTLVVSTSLWHQIIQVWQGLQL